MKQTLLPFEKLWPLLESQVASLGTESVDLDRAEGRILRRPACARWDLPMASNSAMDGFAVRTEDVHKVPQRLRITPGDAYAGSTQTPVLQPGCAIAIGTGGVIPEGADAVVPKENLSRDSASISVEAPAQPGDHIRFRGEELRAGDVVVDQGLRLDPIKLAALTMAGVCEVEVSRCPRACVLTSGNEVVAAGEPTKAGQVVDSNGPFLRRSLSAIIDGDIRQLPTANDSRDELCSTLSSALVESDLVIVTGGVSVGDRDLVKAVLEEDLGVERVVWRVAQKPGKPLYVGRKNAAWVLGLPGNPAAVAAMFTMVVAPLTRALMGAAQTAPSRFPARLAKAITPNRTRTHLRWARVAWDSGVLEAEAFSRSDSHMLSDFARAEILLVVPPGNEELPSGTVLEAVWLRS